MLDYGLLFWAERRVPSGIAAVMMATIPVFMVLAEILLLGTQRLTAKLAFALALGIGGVGVLVSRSLSLGEVPIDAEGAIALAGAPVSGVQWNSTPPMVSFEQMCTYAASGESFHVDCFGT